MTDPVTFSLKGGNGEQARLGVFDDFTATENGPADFNPGLVSLAFIKAAIRRSVWFVSFLAAVGLIAGYGVYEKRPHSYQASASVLLTLGPYEDVQTAITNNEGMAKTSPVATLALRQLGLQQSVSASNFLNTYTVTSATSRVLTVVASGPSAQQAVLRAGVVANAFLTFRANELRAQQNLVVASLNQQINQAKQNATSIAAQLSQLSSQPGSSARQSKIDSLRAEQVSTANSLTGLQEAVTSNQVGTLPALTAAVKSSQLLSVTPIPYPKKKILVTYVGLGLIAGLAVGLGLVLVRAMVSDRLRRRDDVAYALDAPVKLSVHTLRARRRLLPWPGRAAKRDRDMRRVVSHLHSAMPRSTQGPVGLAVVAVDNAPVVARAVAALATSHGSQGHQVVVADLSRGAHLARLLGVKGSGTHAVSRNGVSFTIAVPDRDDAASVGPLPPAASPKHAHSRDQLVASHAPADLLLTLVTLDPALGGDHLATWATTAIVVVSAGESSAERIHGVGEMIRLSGTRLDSAVLIGADKDDESLGLARRPDEQADLGVLGR